MTAPSSPTKKANRLIHEKSPYLQQHAYNPVDWYSWGDEAFAEARKRNVPIFLSIGYSTCHWCHVMEHESFEDLETAALMNECFVNIKVDREERPDLDAIYMIAVQMITGSGGWPMSVWLTHDLKPFYGGTYFPPDDRYGRPGFKAVLTQLSDLWREHGSKVAETSAEISSLIDGAYRQPAVEKGGLPGARATLATAARELRSMFDSTHGGFGPAPKFPMPVYLECLLAHYACSGDKTSLDMVDFTMRCMAKGGLTDQLGGGFARYSTDEKWVVPHFEKMLYDNAQLIAVAATLYRFTNDAFFKQVADGAVTYALRDLRHPRGAFYSAEDADSEGKEGMFYLWTLNEIKMSLETEEADYVIYRYGITAEGNFFDPHTREAGKNILVQTHEMAEVAAHFKVSVEHADRVIRGARKKLFDRRARRPRPHLDDKILTEWNGLMISALATAGVVLERPSYTSAAREAVQFVRESLYDASARRLYRRWRDGERKIEGQQADYAMLVHGLLDLFEATGEAEWLSWAVDLEREQDALFFDAAAGGYFMNVPRPDLMVRLKDDGDNVIPSGNSIAVSNGFRLAKLLDDKDFYGRAQRTLKTFASRLEERPMSLTRMAVSFVDGTEPSAHVIVLGDPATSDARALLQAARSARAPGTMAIPLTPGAAQKALARLMPYTASMAMLNGRATAFVCVNYSCSAPTTDPGEVTRQLGRLNGEVEKK